MSKWKKVKLGDIFEITSGGTPSKTHPEYYENGTIYWVKTGDLKGKYLISVPSLITEAGLKNSSAKIFPIGTILLAMYGATIGACSILKVEAATNQACAAFLPNEDIDNSYFYYFLCSKREEFIKLGVGGAQPNISAAILKNVRISLPPLEEQKRIADILDKARNLIDLRKQQLEKMNLLIKSKFIDMFGDPVTNPKRWEVMKLSELGCWNSGGTPSRGNLEYFEGDIDWYSAGELNDLFLINSNERITNKAIKESAAKLFEAGSLLIGMYDTAAFKMGILTKNASSNQACANIKPSKRMNVIWLYFNLLQMKNHFLQNRRGIRQKNLNLGMIKGFYIPAPPIAFQNQFAAFVEQIEKQKAVMQQSLEKMETNYKALMQEYFG